MADGVTVVKDLWPKIRANLSLAKKSYAAVGFPSEKDKPHKDAPGSRLSGMTNGQLAALMEVGRAPGGDGPAIPARPFLAATMKRCGPKFKEEQKSLLKMISSGEMSTKVALNRLGNIGASEVKVSIGMAGNTPYVPGQTGGWKMNNAPYTIARKGSDTPLVNGGALVQAVTWIVRMRSDIAKKAWDTASKRAKGQL